MLNGQIITHLRLPSIENKNNKIHVIQSLLLMSYFFNKIDYQNLLKDKKNISVHAGSALGCGLESHRRQCVVSLGKTLYPLLSAGSTQVDPSRHDIKDVDLDIKNKLIIRSRQWSASRFRAGHVKFLSTPPRKTVF